MRKNFLTVMAAALLVVGLTACGGGDNAIKFSTYEARNGEAVITIDIPQGEGEKQQNISKGILDIMAGSAIAKEVGKMKEGNLKEVADDFSAQMNELLNSGDYGPATADLTIEATYLNEASATFHVYDGVYVNGEPDVYDRVLRLSDGHVMEQDEMVKISAEDLQSLIEKNLKEEIPVYLEDGYWMLPAGEDSCRVFWLISRAGGGEVMIPIAEMEPFLTEEGKALMTAKPLEFTISSGDEAESTESEDSTEDEANEPNDASVIFSNGKLGPVEVGKAMPNLPMSVDELYDKFNHKMEEHEDEMDGAWTEDYYLFMKDGKEVFRANIYEGKVNSIRLLSGSSFIKTPDGISVGSSARVLFNKVPMEWGTYYEGETFGTNGHFTYYVNSDDLIQTDIPHKADHFKPDAKVVGIVYQ